MLRNKKTKKKPSPRAGGDDDGDHRLASALSLLSEQRQLADSLVKRLEAAVIAIERERSTSHKTWRERLQTAKSAIGRFSTWKSLLVWAFLIVGFASSIYNLSPRISLSIGERIDPNDPMSSQLIISNDGALPIYDVRVDCTAGVIFQKNGPTIQIHPGGRFHTKGDEAPRVGPGQKFTIPWVCHTAEPIEFNVRVTVSFKPLFLPFDHRDFRINSARLGKTVVAVQNPSN